MRLTKQTSHAIRILIHCARARGELVKVAEIADQLELTQQNVFKIVHLLARAGFLKAARGRYGGVRLARPPAEIRIGDVVRATEVTHVAIQGDEAASSSGRRKPQPISRVLDSALEAFIGVLDQHTLEEMARTPSYDAALQPREKPARSKRVSAKAGTGKASDRLTAVARR